MWDVNFVIGLLVSMHFLMVCAAQKEQDALPTYRVESAYELGCQYQEGKNGKERSIAQAQECFEKAAHNGHALALYRLGKILLHESNVERAYDCFEKAAQQQEALSSYEIAARCKAENNATQERLWLEKCIAILPSKKDPTYYRSVVLMQADAGSRLGHIYVLAHSYVEAFMALKKAVTCNAFHEEACLELAVLYYEGKGVPRNTDAAKSVLMTISETSPSASVMLGNFFRQENNVAQAITHYNRALPHHEAHYHLGIFCEQGLGTVQNLDQAHAHFQEAALKGHKESRDKLRPLLETHPGVQCLFGRLYYKGIGVELNEKEGCFLLKKAYRGGCTQALTFLKQYAQTSKVAANYLQRLDIA